MSVRRERASGLSPSDVVRCRRLDIVDDEGRIRVRITTTPSGEMPWMSFRDTDGEERLIMGIYPDGTPFLLLWGESGYALFHVPPMNAS